VTALTVPAALRASARAFPDVEAVVDGAARCSFPELAERVRQHARALMASGITPGDRVALWAPNSLRWVESALGVLSCGAVLVPVNTRLKGEEALHVLRTSRSSMLLVDDGFLGNSYVELLRRAAGDAAGDGAADRGGATRGQPVPGLEGLFEVVVFGGSDDPTLAEFDELLGRAGQVSEASAELAASAVSPGDVSDIMFTSGTTGRPKGAMLTHGQSIRLYRAWADNVGLQSGDRYLAVNPFFHCFGYKAGVIACLARGATLLPLAVFDAVDAMRLVEDERASVIPGTPTLYLSLLDHPRRQEFDLSSLRVAITGGSVVPDVLIRRMHDDLGVSTVINAYGLTESCGTVTGCRPGDPDDVIANTSGRPYEDVELSIIDPSGAVLPTGEPGEILARGYNIMVGYFDDPIATAAAIDADGWLHTGDVGVVDDLGNLRITGRTKEMFVVGGFNAYPAEIEQALMHHGAVSEVAVVPVPDARLGEVGRAFVVLRPDAVATVEELIAYGRDHLANYKVPRSIVFLDALPRNGTGKVDKHALEAGASLTSSA
jgi:acyl-CoA synthetase (AMP-forming)/AMP-acid ligase II